MQIGSTEFLGLLAKGNYILFEKGLPSGRLKRDFITLRTPDGRALSLTTSQGFQVNPVELPRAILDDFIAASFVEQDGREDAEGRIVFRLTPDGLERAG